MRERSLHGLVLLFVACASGRGASHPNHVVEPVASESQPFETVPYLDRAVALVSQKRGLAVRKPVKGARVSRTVLATQIRAHVAREVPERDVEAEEAMLKLLGVVARDVNYREVVLAMLGSDVAGYYEPADMTLYVSDDIKDAAGVLALIHEVEHALQDQYFGLGKRMKRVSGQSDALIAASALAEGDATLAMVAVQGDEEHVRDGIQTMRDRLVRKVEDNVTVDQPGPPRIVQRSILASYAYGFVFVSDAFLKGGWPTVNPLWENPPVTSEQLLHPDKYRDREIAESVPSAAEILRNEGYEIVTEDTYGELSIRLLLSELQYGGVLQPFGAGWAGDRGVVAKRKGHYAFVWRMRYDHESDARRDEQAWAWKGRDRMHTTATPCNPNARAVVPGYSAAAGHVGVVAPTAVVLQGRDLVVTAGPASIVADDAGTCSDALRIARAALAQR